MRLGKKMWGLFRHVRWRLPSVIIITIFFQLLFIFMQSTYQKKSLVSGRVSPLGTYVANHRGRKRFWKGKESFPAAPPGRKERRNVSCLKHVSCFMKHLCFMRGRAWAALPAEEGRVQAIF